MCGLPNGLTCAPSEYGPAGVSTLVLQIWHRPEYIVFTASVTLVSRTIRESSLPRRDWPQLCLGVVEKTRINRQPIVAVRDLD